MGSFFRGIGLASIGLSLVGAGAAQAAPSCWQEREVAATRVRQMQTMLMVATLRCRAAKLDISDDYNAFMTAQGEAVSAANLLIKQHFAQDGFSQADYDHYATSLANGYGDDQTDQASCADAAALAHEAMVAKEAGALDKVAQARLFPAAMPGGACGAPAMTLASAEPAKSLSAKPAGAAKPAAATVALPPMLALAAPAPLPVEVQPVMLPADVTAALAVMAKLATAPQPAVHTGPVQVAAIGQ